MWFAYLFVFVYFLVVIFVYVWVGFVVAVVLVICFCCCCFCVIFLSFIVVVAVVLGVVSLFHPLPESERVNCAGTDNPHTHLTETRSSALLSAPVCRTHGAGRSEK